MFLIDDLLLSPFKGLLWIFREVQEAAENEMAEEKKSLKNRLSELYMELGAGKIGEEEFEAEEKRILDRLEALEGEEEDE